MNYSEFQKTFKNYLDNKYLRRKINHVFSFKQMENDSDDYLLIKSKFNQDVRAYMYFQTWSVRYLMDKANSNINRRLYVTI